MKEKIMILNVMKYTKESKLKGRVGFIILNPQTTDKYKGYSDIACYYNVDESFLDKFKPDMFLEPIIGIFEERANYSDSLSVRKVLKAIEYKGNVINLL